MVASLNCGIVTSRFWINRALHNRGIPKTQHRLIAALLHRGIAQTPPRRQKVTHNHPRGERLMSASTFQHLLLKGREKGRRIQSSCSINWFYLFRVDETINNDKRLLADSMIIILSAEWLFSLNSFNMRVPTRGIPGCHCQPRFKELLTDFFFMILNPL